MDNHSYCSEVHCSGSAETVPTIVTLSVEGSSRLGFHFAIFQTVAKQHIIQLNAYAIKSVPHMAGASATATTAVHPPSCCATRHAALRWPNGLLSPLASNEALKSQI
jgi:hypothetical protein